MHRLREMGLAGRKPVVERFSYLHMARSFERVYRAVIGAFETGQGAPDAAGGG